jgi:hypothetical protein
VRERSEASAAPEAADSQRLKEDDEEEEGPVSLRKRSFASRECVILVEKRRWWMGVADRERESVVVGRDGGWE